MNGHPRRAAAVVAAVAVGLGWQAHALAAGAPLPQQIDLRLHAAVFRTEAQEPDSPALLLHLTRVGDRWERVVGTAGNLSRGIHLGYVTEATLTDGAMDIALDINVVGDGYLRIDERGSYRVRLSRKEGRRFEGTYAGTYRGVEVKGRADALLLPPLAPPKPGFHPVQPGEHPRILFRKSDLPALRRKAKTPFGQAALGRMNDAVGLGVKYQLSGERAYADQARAFVEPLLAGEYSRVRAPGSHHGMLHWGPVWEQAAVAYDLCYHAWPEAFKRRVESFLWLWTRRILFQHMMFNTQAQYDFGNSEAGWYHYAIALGGLALWGERGPEPVKPLPPDPIVELPPAADYTPGEAVPVIALEPGKPPSEWLYTKPINHYVNADPLAECGGWARCRPERGIAFTCDGERRAFEPLPPEFVPEGGGVVVNIGKSLQPGHVQKKPGPEIIKDGPITMCLYTVLRNDQPRWVKVFAPFSPNGWQQFVLSGHSLAHGQVVKLGQGLYSLLIILRVQARWRHLETRLDPATEADLEQSNTLMARLQAMHKHRLKDWAWDVAEWRRTGGANQRYQKLFAMTRWLMYFHFREGFGSGAAQSDTAGMCHTLGLLPGTYATAYRHCFGHDVSPHPDITHFISRRVFAHVYPPTGEPVTLSVNGPNDLGPGYFAAHFPLVPDAWKPVVLWAWHRHLDIAGPSGAEAILTQPIDSLIARAFLHYPLGTEPKPPKGVLPLAWEAPDYGYYGFRNTWEGRDDFLVQVYGRCHTPHGYSIPNAGNFVICGLGHVWARAMPSLRLHNQRAFANVVLLPDDDTHEGACGRLLYARTEPDGSGAVTFDLSDVYGSVQRDRKGRPLRLYEKYGLVRRASVFRETGIRGLRAVGVDYSRTSGAPCLVAIVDRIMGGNAKLWCWRLKDEVVDKRTKERLEPGDLDYTRVEGNTVTLARPDGASMRLTFVAPSPVEVKAEKQQIIYTKTYNRGKGTLAAPGIYASGADPSDGRFFVVATIQRGDPPPIKVEGTGLDAVVTIGGQTVSFDGRRVVFGGR